MKTLLPLTVLALSAAFTLSAFAGDKLVTAGDVLLSPRAKGNQVQAAAGIDRSANTATQNRNVSASPRHIGNQARVARGVDSSPSTIAGNCAIGSPRQLEQAGKFSTADCCKVTTMACTTPRACCPVAAN